MFAGLYAPFGQLTASVTNAMIANTNGHRLKKRDSSGGRGWSGLMAMGPRGQNGRKGVHRHLLTYTESLLHINWVL